MKTTGPERTLEVDYSLLPSAAAHAGRLIEQLEDFSHLVLAQPGIGFLASRPPLYLHGVRANACIGPSRVQAVAPLAGMWAWFLEQLILEGKGAGLTGDVTNGVDYLVLVDAAVWGVLDDVGRERLMYHELCHLAQKRDRDDNPRFDQQGRPVLALVPHDYEFFDSEVRRYGPAVCGLEGAQLALAEGKRRPRVRSTLRKAG